MNGQPGLPAGSDTRASAGPAVQTETGHREPNLWGQAISTLAGQGGNPISCPQTPNTPGPQLPPHHPVAAPPGSVFASRQTDVPVGKNLPDPPPGAWASLVAQMVKNLPAVQETGAGSLGKDPLEKGMAIHSSTLSWSIPWTDGPGGLQPTGSQKSWTRFSG